MKPIPKVGDIAKFTVATGCAVGVINSTSGDSMLTLQFSGEGGHESEVYALELYDLYTLLKSIVKATEFMKGDSDSDSTPMPGSAFH